MDIVRFAIDNPVKVSVGVILALLFGLIALTAIPIQLTPDVDQPIITVTTRWAEGSPVEIEREIIERQEDVLANVKGLTQLIGIASQGQAEMEMEFAVGTDVKTARQEVSDSLREVPEYPDDADEPVITVADAALNSPIAWMILDSDDPDFDMQAWYDYADEQIKPLLERVDGVGQVDIFGGRERQVHVQIDPARLAQRQVSVGDLARALQGQNISETAGQLTEGRLDLQVRAVGNFETIDAVEQTVIAYDDAGPVRVRDVATVSLTLEKRRGFVRLKGESALAVRVLRESGANVMATMRDLRAVVDHINHSVIPQMPYTGSPDTTVSLRFAYDQTVYIDDAISLVLNNLVVGGILAVVSLLIFLEFGRRPLLVCLAVPGFLLLLGLYFLMPQARAAVGVAAAVLGLLTVFISRPTGVIGIAIPISVIGTFVVMAASGRNLNVISLAGLAFAVGMVVDAAIVVLENIDRHAAMGKPPHRAAYDGAREVWGAVLASTLTTAVVFIPVVVIQEEAGQLFRDIAIAIIAAVLLSMLVSITVIPSASAHLVRERGTADSVFAVRALQGIARAAGRLVELFASLVHGIVRSPVVGDRWRVALTLAAFGLVAAGVTLLATHLDDVHALKQSVLTADAALGDAQRLTLGGAALVLVGVLLLPVRLAIVGGVTTAALALSWLLMPPTSYLPNGNQNLVFGIMLNPPGYNLPFQQESVAGTIEDVVAPYWEAQSDDELEALEPPRNPFTQQPIQDVPRVAEFFLVTFNGNMFMGGRSEDPQNVAPLAEMISASMSGVPGSFGFASQASIFGRDLGGSNSLQLQLTSNDLDQLRASAGAIYAALMQDPDYGPQKVQPSPINFNLTGPELEVRIDRERAGALGVDLAAASLGMRALIDGAIVGEFRNDGDAIDLLVVRDPDIPASRSLIEQMPIPVTDPQTGDAYTIPFASIVDFVTSEAPQQIRRIEQQRAVSFAIQTPPGLPLETAEANIESLVASLREEGQVSDAVQSNMAGTADKLTQVRRSLLGEWAGLTTDTLRSVGMSKLFLALLVVYLLMCALFESFTYPLVILFSVPLATVGGFAGLALMHARNPDQQLDVLTMLGFVILIGIVVNNAILLVHQSLNFMRGVGEGEGDDTGALPPDEAIRRAVASRVRPILMTTFTSVAGMLPLVLSDGAGNELYRGLGSVVVGGLVTSTIFTLLVVPTLFSLAVDAQATLNRWTRQASSPA